MGIRNIGVRNKVANRARRGRYVDAGRFVRVAWAPSLARRLLRKRWLWIALTIAVAVSGVATVNDQRSRLDEHAQAWGEQSAVVLVAKPIRAGEPLLTSIELVQRPAAMIPSRAIRELPSSAAIAKVDLFAGEMLLADRVADSADDTGNDRRSMTVAIEGPAARVDAGDLVDLWVTDQRTATAVEVVANVVVLERADGDLTVAVPYDQVGAVAAASSQPLTVALVG